jgi:hypothetical protein
MKDRDYLEEWEIHWCEKTGYADWKLKHLYTEGFMLHRKDELDPKSDCILLHETDTLDDVFNVPEGYTMIAKDKLHELQVAKPVKKQVERKPRPKSKGKTKGQEIYEARVSGRPWSDLKDEYGQSALVSAKKYAQSNNFEWPIDTGVFDQSPQSDIGDS